MNIYLFNILIITSLSILQYIFISKLIIKCKIKDHEDFLKPLISDEIKDIKSQFDALSFYCGYLSREMIKMKKSKWQCYHNKMVDNNENDN